MDKFCDRLKYALDEQNIKAARLAECCRIDKSAISKYLHGTIVPGPEKIVTMAIALRVSPLWLLGYDKELPDLATISKTEIDETRLTPRNREKLHAYYQGLLDSQGD